MFSMASFLKDNLITGYLNNSFTLQQVVIFSFNYLSRGQITQQDFDEIQLVLYPDEEVEEERAGHL